MSDDEIADFIMDQQNIILDELNVKSIDRVQSEFDLLRYHIKPNLQVLGQKFGKEVPAIQTILAESDSHEILEEIRLKKSYEFDLNGKSVSIGRDDLLFNTESVDGFTTSGDDHVTVGLTTKLTKKLIQEGIVREIRRAHV